METLEYPRTIVTRLADMSMVAPGFLEQRSNKERSWTPRGSWRTNRRASS